MNRNWTPELRPFSSTKNSLSLGFLLLLALHFFFLAEKRFPADPAGEFSPPPFRSCSYAMPPCASARAAFSVGAASYPAVRLARFPTDPQPRTDRYGGTEGWVQRGYVHSMCRALEMPTLCFI